jgi:hypothetical protein
VVYTSFGWTTVINALKADASTANDSTANASLPASSLTPNLDVHSANGRAIGLNTPPAMSSDASIGGTFDGIVTLNAAASFQFTRPVTSGNYDALRALEHEVDEVLGFGSSIGVFTSLEPQDLFSWSSAGTRSMSTSGSRYFSINSGTTNIVGFNQSSNGDYGDWLSGSCPQATPYVQNAFSCSGQQSDVTPTSPEGINLDVIGYNLSTTSTLVDAPTSVIATAGSTTSVAISWSAPSGTGPSRYHVYRSSNHTTYTQVNAESTSGTSFTDSTASPNTAYLYKVRSVDSASAESADSNVDLATTTIFTDSTLSAQITKVKAAHITELRTAVNAVRTLAGLSAYTFTDPSLTATVTGLKKVHITDLRTALDAARSTLGLTPLTYTDSTITIGATKVKGAHTTELRNGVK